MNGYTGKILRVNLSSGEISVLPTRRYEQWGGGHGIGSALFWELAKNKAVSGFDPRNVVTIMTSPLAGTLAPGASARVEVQGIGVQSYPIEWFTRSNMGGRFGTMLKAAGWDGIAIEGRSEQPVWIDIRNSDVKIKNAKGLWGLDTWQAQLEIWQQVSPGIDPKPAVLVIGPAGEHLSRIACLIHDAGHAAGQGGFGGVWGAKNLKAISVIGTGGVSVANPSDLLKARLWSQRGYGLDPDHPESSWYSWHGPMKPQIILWESEQKRRLKACAGCHLGCREITGTGLGNETICVPSVFYRDADKEKHQGKQSESVYIAANLLQKYGINAYEAFKGLHYIRGLNTRGLLGPGMAIDCDLNFKELGETEFAEKFLEMIAYRKGTGDDFAEGFYRASQRWGRLEEDLKSGLLEYPYWGLPDHGCDPRTQVEWGYGSILGDRDICEHDFSSLSLYVSKMKQKGLEEPFPAETAVRIFSEKVIPFEGDMQMFDYSTDNIYSESVAKLVAWHRHYNRFWKQSVLYCELRWPDFISSRSADLRGMTPEAEPKFFNAVTGKDISFSDGITIGRKIWNLDNAIWTLQGRHRDMVHFADYIYTKPFEGNHTFPQYYVIGKKDGKWDYISANGRHLDRAEFEAFKTRYYRLEGWDTNTGWPLRKTLESLGLGYVADELEMSGAQK